MLRQRKWYGDNLLFSFIFCQTSLRPITKSCRKILPLFAASEVLYFPQRTVTTHFRIKVKRMGAAERINARRVTHRSTLKDSSVEEERWQRQRDTRPLMEYTKLWSNQREESSVSLIFSSFCSTTSPTSTSSSGAAFLPLLLLLCAIKKKKVGKVELHEPLREEQGSISRMLLLTLSIPLPSHICASTLCRPTVERWCDI